jgi:prepilin-type N-terminal cleavage/methylation domain-containing protein
MKRNRVTSCLRSVRRAFTLFELLAVISIILVLVAVTTPAVSSLVASANFSAAVNSLTGTLGNARAVAISRGERTGVVFTFDIETQEYTLQVVELAPSGSRGQLTESTTTTSASIDASVFIPARNTTPVVLPTGTAVYGLSFAHMRDRIRRTPPFDPLNPATTSPTQLWYAGEVFESPDNAAWEINPWIFPRNDPRLYLDERDDIKDNRTISLEDVWNVVAGGSFAPSYVNFTRTDAVLAVRHAQSFIVMFGPDGVVVPAVDDAGQDVFNAFVELPDSPVDFAPNDPLNNVPYDSPTLFDPEVQPPGTVNQPSTNPEIWVRSVEQLAVVELRPLSASTGVDRPWMLHPSTSQAPWPRFRGRQELVNNPITATDSDLDDWVRDVGLWIDSNAEIIGFDRYTGVAQRRRSEQ